MGENGNEMCELDDLVGTRRDVEEVYDAVVAGLAGSFKTGPVVIGLSGGADSGVLAAMAVEAFGARRVRGVGLPGPYSTPGSLTDAEATADMLDIGFDVVSIVDTYDTLTVALHGQRGAPGVFDGTVPDVAEENIQARLRAVVLMAVTNKFGGVVLNTSNGSELAVGYGTLYGDLVGALSPFAEVFKSGGAGVWALGREANRRAGRAVVPESTLSKPPSAELAPGQVDQQVLPAYDVLDRVLAGYLYVTSSLEQVAGLAGVPVSCVSGVVARVEANRFKAAQVPPGISLASTELGRRRARAAANRV